MKRYLLLLIFSLSVCCGCATASADSFDKYFEKKSLRIDFALTGNSETQFAAVSQLRKEPVWSGPLTNLIDPFDYGHYRINIYDRSGGELIFSRGMATLFEEWRATPQAKEEMQSWINSISIPFPKSEIIFELLYRDNHTMEYESLIKMSIRPDRLDIDASPLHANEVVPILDNGDPNTKVDLVFVAEGYSAGEREKFISDAQRFSDTLFRTSPFSEHREDFNVWAVALVSEESGTDRSGEGIFKNTALSSGFYTFGIDRYLTTKDMKGIRDAVWNVPNDAVFVLVNDSVYGGGGMYNLYACGTADNRLTLEVFTHELGHSFAGLADEYYTSEVAVEEFYAFDKEPWEPNITTLVDFESKWKHMIPDGTPVPTPLEMPYKESCGVYEGAGYSAKGIYRPMDHCMMRDFAPFCPVCSEAIVMMIDYYCGREVK